MYSIAIGYFEGLVIQDLCRVNYISPSTLYSWREKFIETGSEALLNGSKSAIVAKLEKENKLLKQKVGDLALDNELITKTCYQR